MPACMSTKAGQPRMLASLIQRLYVWISRRIPSLLLELRQVVVVCLSVAKCCSISICSRFPFTRFSFSTSCHRRSSMISALCNRGTPASLGRDLVVCGVHCHGEWGRPRMPPIAVTECHPSLCRSVLTM